MNKRNWMIFAVAAVCILAVGTAQAGEWKKIGNQTLLFKSDSDTIKIKKNDVACYKLMLKVGNKSITVSDVTITFDDGSAQKVALNERIKPGDASSVIEIDGGAKKIATVEFNYEPTNGQSNGRAFVTLMGAAGAA